jgi:PRC-barrel domain
MNKICTAASLVALMAIPAFAQDATTPNPASPSAPVERQDAGAPPAAAPAPATELAPAATPDAAIPDAIPDKSAEKSAVPDVPNDKMASLGSEVAASDLLNQKVKNPANETVGDINDLSIGGDGKIAAVIIGVGGFLGMGEKNVSLPYDQLTFSRDANGNLVVSVNISKESLQSAPEWKPSRS